MPQLFRASGKTTRACGANTTASPKFFARLASHKLQVIEVRLCIGLRPEPDLARVGEGPVTDIQVSLAVVGTLDVVAGHCDTDREPVVAVPDVGALKLGALAVHDLVDTEVI